MSLSTVLAKVVFNLSHRPDITVMVDWALQINYLSIYLSVSMNLAQLGLCVCFVGLPVSTRNRTRGIGGSNLDSALPVKVLIHGFLQSERSPWILETTHTLLEHVRLLTFF